MGVSSLLNTVLLIAAFQMTSTDFLESFRPTHNNPRELNEFLSNVLEHRSDFNYAREAARKYQKIKKSSVALENMNPYASTSFKNAGYDKRHAHHYSSNKKFHKQHSFRNGQRNKQFNRMRRTVKHPVNYYLENVEKREENPPVEKHIPVEIFVEPDLIKVEKRSHDELEVQPESEIGQIERDEGEKRSLEHQNNMKKLKQATRKDTENKNSFYSDFADKMSGYDSERRGYELPQNNRFALDENYPDYEFDPERSISDQVAFEKALSYEMEPRFEENNPRGNSLMSVESQYDDLHPLSSKEMYAPVKFQNHETDYPQFPDLVSNERFFLDSDKNLQRVDSMAKKSSTTQQPKHGFIQIQKSKRFQDTDTKTSIERNSLNAKQDEEGKQFQSKLFLHPLRLKEVNEKDHFQFRKLQFVRDDMINSYNDEYSEFEVKRNKRGFLDAFDMKNEEDYTDDIPEQSDMTVNNTDVHNSTTPVPPLSTCRLFLPTNKSHSTTAFTAPKKANISTIKDVFTEPSEMTGDETMIGDFTTEIHNKARESKENINNKVRKQRDLSNEMESKILINQDKIYNHYEDAKDIKSKQNEATGINQPKLTYIPTKKFARRDQDSVEKSAEINELIDSALASSFVTITQSPDTIKTKNISELNATEIELTKGMDEESEKLVQLVNGRVALTIVATVFEDLKKKLALKEKLFTGMSRKYEKYTPRIDMDVFTGNETEDTNEARILLSKITKVLNKLIWKQVQKKMCQRLSQDLKDYLESILNAKKIQESPEFEVNTDQGDFLFQEAAGENKNSFDIKKLQNTLTEFETLLLNYDNLNEDCKARAAPVKEYLEKHINILQRIISCPSNNCVDSTQGAKRDLNEGDEKLPTGKKKTYQKRNVRNNYKEKSEQYRKLQFAAQKIREKRENERKIVELFGKNKDTLNQLDLDYEEPMVYSLR